MSYFEKLWYNKVRKLASDCVDAKLVWLLTIDSSYISDEDNAYLKQNLEKYKDICGMLCITSMIWRIEHALADGRESQARIAAKEVFTVLNRPSYFENVFHSDCNDEEWKTRAALRDGLKELL